MSFLPKVVFGLGVVLIMGPALTIVGPWAIQQVEQVAEATDTGSGPGVFGRIGDYFSTALEKPKPRWELDQAALPETPEGWNLVVGVGGGQTHGLAKRVYQAMHNPEGPLDVDALAAFGAVQQPNGLLSEALSGARSSIQAVGASEAEADAQTAVSPVMVQFGGRIARKNDEYDQSRIYVSGEDVVMVMVRRLPRSYRSKGSWLQVTSPGTPVAVEPDGHTFLESARTAESDEIHALRLDLTSDLFIEIGGRVDRDVLESFVKSIDFTSL